MNTHRTKVLITVDTEPSVAGAFLPSRRLAPLIHEPIAGMVDGESAALGRLLDALRTYGVAASFFVEAIHPSHFGDEPMGRYVAEMLQAGQDVQLHVHPCWEAFRDRSAPPWPWHTDLCDELDEATLTDLFSRGVEQVVQWSGKRPVCIRTGNHAVSGTVYRAIAGAGLRFSSSVNVAQRPPSERELHFIGGVHLVNGVRELPITCYGDKGWLGTTRMRSLAITACSSSEMTSLLDLMHVARYPCVVILTHPFEFVKARGSRYERIRPNQINLRRLNDLLAHLTRHVNRFETLTVADFVGGNADVASSAPPLLANTRAQAVARMVENGLNDRIWRL